MKYFKYIIILILFLLCALLYMQLDDYDNISTSLLNDNIETKEEMIRLSNSVNEIKENALKLQEKINTLYSIIDEREIEIELLEENCIENKATTETIPTQMDKSNITLENENEVTGF